MSKALRQVFCELGFDIDLPTLEKAEQKIRSTIKTTDKAAKATDDAAKKKNKAHKSEADAAKDAGDAEEKAGKKGAKGANAGEVATKRFAAVLKAFGVDAKGASELIETFGGIANLKLLGTGAALAVVVKGAFAFADSFAPVAEELRDTARESRVTTTELQELRHVAVQGGVGVERMNSGVATFGASLRNAQRWGNGTTSTLRRLGIQARDSSGQIRPTGDLMNEVAVAMEHVENPMRRARIATQLFGESGRRMLDVLHTGPGGIRALREELAELGGGVTPEAVAASREYTMATEKLSRAQDSLRSVLAVALLPVLSWVTTGVAKLGGLLARLTNGTHVVQVALAALGVVGAAVALALIAAWAPVAAPYLGIAAAVGAVVLAFDDLITFVEGGDSAIGRFIDTVWGVGTATEYVHELREEWEAVQDALAGAIGAVAHFLGLQEEVAVGHLSPPAGTPGAPRRGAATGTGATRSTISPAALARNRGEPPPALNPTTVPGNTLAALPFIRVPATRAVAAPGSVRGGSRTVTRTFTSAPTLHFHGVTDADVIADRVRTTLRQEDSNRRDADHPTEDDEG